MKLKGKKGLETQTIILLVLGLVIALSIILIITGRQIPETTKEVEVIGKDLEELWLQLLEKETPEEQRTRVVREREFLTFYNKFIQHFNNCLAAENSPCYCTFKDFALFPENYRLTLTQRKDDAYYSLPFYVQEGNPLLLQDAGVHPVTKQFSLCSYGDKNIYIKTLDIYSKDGKLYVKGQEGEHPLSGKGITFYKSDKNALCILPAGMELPTIGQYGPKGVVRKKVPVCKLPASS